MKIIKNMTPHDIIIMGEKRLILQSEGLIRLSQSTKQVGLIKTDKGNISLSETTFGSTQLPKEDKDTILIVSSIVCQAFPDRKDLFIVNETIRDEQGRIIGCKSISRNPFFRG